MMRHIKGFINHPVVSLRKDLFLPFFVNWQASYSPRSLNFLTHNLAAWVASDLSFGPHYISSIPRWVFSPHDGDGSGLTSLL